ncbi:hypothetical protein BGT96224_A20085 [Blumeria graminis f. sp. tritici 96224]|nr:hypothetical protein BGT96224_A20085 [Blumeria graminis f. sp. tritici 96224]
MNSGEGVEGDKLIEWFLEQKENELAGEDDYHAEMSLTKKIMKRMVKENILMAIRGQGLTNESGQAGSNAGDSVVYVLHPNYAVSDL